LTYSNSIIRLLLNRDPIILKNLDFGGFIIALKDLYILLEGEVTLGIKAKGEVDMTAYSMGKKGEVFGLPSLIKPYRNSVSAICTKRTRVFSIHGEVLRKKSASNKRSRKGSPMKNKIPDNVLKSIFQRKLKRRSINEDVYQRIKKMILSGKLTDGQRLIQEEVALHFNVSRQTIRNAFLQLEKDKLIISKLRKGVFVSFRP
jgi:DNA-binding transcriptional regulator YhcF (GntR family)